MASQADWDFYDQYGGAFPGTPGFISAFPSAPAIQLPITDNFGGGGGGQVGTILGPVIQEIPAVVSSIGAGMTLSKALCAMFPSLCNGSSSLSNQTPNAGLLTGSCPPGRVLRRISMGRDKCIKKPRMNPLNPKALMRATRRLAGFQNFAVRTEKTIQKSFRKAGVFKTSSRRPAARCGTCAKKSCGGC